MASPKMEVLFLYDLATGAPKTGVGIAFDTYKDSNGVNVTPPAISEIGGGAYGFIPTFSSPDKGIVYIVNAGASAMPQRQGRYIRPEDWNIDNADIPSSSISEGGGSGKIDELYAIMAGKWEIKTAGPDANHMLIYAENGTTVIRKFALYDSNGVPTSTNPFKRSPV